jgi:hypothetical protein
VLAFDRAVSVASSAATSSMPVAGDFLGTGATSRRALRDG